MGICASSTARKPAAEEGGRSKTDHQGPQILQLSSSAVDCIDMVRGVVRADQPTHACTVHMFPLVCLFRVSSLLPFFRCPPPCGGPTRVQQYRPSFTNNKKVPLLHTKYILRSIICTYKKLGLRFPTCSAAMSATTAVHTDIEYYLESPKV